MTNRAKTGGRKPGQPNKLTAKLNDWMDRALKVYSDQHDMIPEELHPVVRLLDIAFNNVDDIDIPIDVQERAASKLLPYFVRKMPETIEVDVYESTSAKDKLLETFQPIVSEEENSEDTVH